MYYRRANTKGGTFFFTVNLADRSSAKLTDHISDLRNSFHRVRVSHPFEILAIAVLPDHLHSVWQLPDGDSNYPIRWSLIKAAFSRSSSKTEFISRSRKKKRERGIWQRRCWEHQIGSETDLQHHVNYIHINPVKHGYVDTTVEWPYSSIYQTRPAYARLGSRC
jgi:putative transposase